MSRLADDLIATTLACRSAMRRTGRCVPAVSAWSSCARA